MNNIDKIERRVRALLAQATDQAGTPEGDAFQARAFNPSPATASTKPPSTPATAPR